MFSPTVKMWCKLRSRDRPDSLRQYVRNTDCMLRECAERVRAVRQLHTVWNCVRRCQDEA